MPNVTKKSSFPAFTLIFRQFDKVHYKQFGKSHYKQAQDGFLSVVRSIQSSRGIFHRKVRGFTLIELLIVIGILAVLATVTLLVINPAQLVKQSRDGNRIAEINQLNQALLLFQSFGGSNSNMGNIDTIYISLPATNPLHTDCSDYPTLPTPPSGWVYHCSPLASYRNIDGTGWVPVDFTFVQSSAGTLFSALPIDPIQGSDLSLAASNGYYYTYIHSSWAVSAGLESDKYLTTTAVNDGGQSLTRFELGNDLTLDTNLPANTGGVATVPGVPTGLTATAGNTQISLTWQAPSSSGSSAIVNYGIYRGITSGSEVWVATTTDTTTSYADGNGLNDSTYYYKVVAANTAGSGSFSNEVVSFATPYTWVANFTSNNVTELNSSGVLVGTYTVGTGPFGIAIDASGNVWVANKNSNNVTELNSSGVLVGTYTVGTGPYGIAIDASGNVWVANSGGNSVTKLNSSGGLVGTYTVGTYPIGIAIDASGNVWVANKNSNNVTELNSSGVLVGTYTVGTGPYGIAIDASGNVWVANSGGNSVTKLNSSGGLVGTYINNGVNISFTGVAIDVSGGIWVTNNGNGDIFKLNSSGIYLGHYNVGTGPYGIAIDASGNVWATLSGMSKIAKLDSFGTILGTYSVQGSPLSIGDMTGFALHYFVLGQR